MSLYRLATQTETEGGPKAFALALSEAIKKAEELGNKLVKLGKKDEIVEEPAAPTIKTCPFCKSEIAIDATRCPHCTSVLED